MTRPVPARLPPSAVLRRALSAARRGGGPLLPLTYVLLGVALVAYVVGMLALAFLAVLVMTLRLVLTPPLDRLRVSVRRSGQARDAA